MVLQMWCVDGWQEWREQRDKLVGQLDQVMNKQIEDNKQLKAQLAEEQDQYGKLVSDSLWSGLVDIPFLLL